MKFSLSVFTILALWILGNQVSADIIVAGNVGWTIDTNSASETINYSTSPFGSFSAGPLPTTGSAIQIGYGSSLSNSLVALNWSVQQTRGASSNSLTVSRLESTFVSGSDLNYTLGLTWNGLSVPSGLAALTVSIKDSLNTTYLSVSANRFQGIQGGGFNTLYAGALQTGNQYTLTVETVLLSGGETTSPASTLGNFNFTIAAVPEPSSLFLVVISGCTLLVRTRCKTRSAD